MHLRKAFLSSVVPLMLVSGCGDSSAPSPSAARGPASNNGTQPTPNSTREDRPGFKADFGVYYTTLRVSGIEEGDGADHREKLLNAIQLQTQRQHAAADRI